MQTILQYVCNVYNVQFTLLFRVEQPETKNVHLHVQSFFCQQTLKFYVEGWQVYVNLIVAFRQKVVEAKCQIFISVTEHLMKFIDNRFLSQINRAEIKGRNKLIWRLWICAKLYKGGSQGSCFWNRHVLQNNQNFVVTLHSLILNICLLIEYRFLNLALFGQFEIYFCLSSLLFDILLFFQFASKFVFFSNWCYEFS